MASIRVVVQGVLGKMGLQVLSTLCDEDGLEPVGAVDLYADTNSITLPDGSGSVPLFTSVEGALVDADVVVDFTNADGALAVMREAAPAGVHVVIGSTGHQDAAYEEAAALAEKHGTGIFIAPNFAVGAVLMVHLAKEAARFFEYADLTEMHHEAKIDAPSGTAIAIAQAAIEGKGADFTAPAAEKELIAGQTLTIRHDSVNRESFMPGVMMAVREIVNRPGLTVGLDKLMGL